MCGVVDAVAQRLATRAPRLSRGDYHHVGQARKGNLNCGLTVPGDSSTCEHSHCIDARFVVLESTGLSASTFNACRPIWNPQNAVALTSDAP